MLKTLLTFFYCAITIGVLSQEHRIKIIHADNTYVDDVKYPDATIFSGNVHVQHQGITLTCSKAIQYKKENIIHAIGNVIINQGDTIVQYSNFSKYNGDTKFAYSWGNVKLKDKTVEISTDTLNFDRVTQVLYYNDNGTILDGENTLKSKLGNYYLETKKFTAQNHVKLTNPKYTLTSEHLDYYTNTKIAYLFGPSTIKTKESTIYSERGFYNTQTDIAHFIKNAKFKSKTQTVEGDSIYYNKNMGFSSASGHVVVTDSLNKVITKGGYAENYKAKDSSIVVDKAMAIIISDKDSLYIHADTLIMSGVEKKRVLRAFHRVKFFKPNLQGKCDSIFSDDATGLTTMFKNPVLWANKSQITGDIIHFTKDLATGKLDSLKVLNNAFIVQKDSAGFNQIKGRDILGKFIENDLQDVDVVGNSEVLYYVRDDLNKLIGINKSTCSYIQFKLKDGEIQTVKFITSPDGSTYPLSQLPENVRLLRGYIWRETEQPLTKEDIFKD
ncbi:MAG: hypothetical protein COS42_12860 [Flavobacteriales bacterium CG03_land_8_20_14_0_80_35_15]|nr:LPS export ABC transporter periplasmic protein LptC [Zetaproteobacteria bacterium]PIV15900.1 MAG: hypothetical protein COS42_12860 [Flavobacteriales bacterium CG03_land_8_20_14_0_80_35_15]